MVKEPAAEQRLEIILAQLCSMFYSVNFKGRKEPKDFMPFLDAWPAESNGRYSDVDQEIIRAFMT